MAFCGHTDIRKVDRRILIGGAASLQANAGQASCRHAA
jgi:hypothetical protein